MAAKLDLVKISAIVGIIASLGGVAGFFFSQDTQRCVGLGGPYRGHPLRAIKHCTDDRSAANASSPINGNASMQAAPGAQGATAATAAEDPRRFGGTSYVFYAGDAKTTVTFDADGTVTFSDPAFGSGGTWKLAGTRGIAFHTDTYEFGGTIGRGVPDSFDVSYRHLPRGSEHEPAQIATFTKI